MEKLDKFKHFQILPKVLRNQLVIMTWTNRVRLLAIILFCYHYAYLHNTMFQPGGKLVAILFLVWASLSYGLNLRRLVDYLKFAWPLLIWALQIFIRRFFEPALYDPSRYAWQICIFTSIAFWYVLEGSRKQIAYLIFTSMFGFFQVAVATIMVSRRQGLAIRSLASISVEQSQGAGGLGSVYLQLYIALLICFYFIKSYRPPKKRILLTLSLSLSLVLIALSQYVLLYALCLLAAFLLFLFSGSRPRQRLLLVFLALVVLYWPLAQFLLFLSKQSLPQVLQIRFEELGNLMLGHFSYSQGHSAFLGRFTRLTDAVLIFLKRPFLGGFGRQMWFFFHHDFQWAGDLAVSGLVAFFFFYFVFFKFRHFLKHLSEDATYRRMGTMFFIVLFFHGTCNRLYSGDLLYAIFTFMPMAIFYYFKEEPEAVALGYVPGRNLTRCLRAFFTALDG